MDSWIIININNALQKWNDTFQEILGLVTQSPQDFQGGTIWNIISQINGALQAAGYALLVLFFCMGVFQTTSSFTEFKKPELTVKMFIRFALAKLAISHGMELLISIYRICQGVLQTVAAQLGQVGTAASLPVEIADAIQQIGFWDGIPLMLVAFIGSIAVTVICFFLLLTVYGRFFRLFLYTAISPLPLSTFAGESTSQFGKSYLKAYVAVCLEGVIILLACIVFSAYASSAPQSIVDLSAGPIQATWDYLGNTIFNLLVLLLTIRTADRICKELLGL